MRTKCSVGFAIIRCVLVESGDEDMQNYIECSKRVRWSMLQSMLTFEEDYKHVGLGFHEDNTYIFLKLKRLDEASLEISDNLGCQMLVNSTRSRTANINIYLNNIVSHCSSTDDGKMN